jgi:ABC-type transport system involved in multi-copper enzyme maturation permease subunit
MMDKTTKEHILGMIFFSIMSISISFMILVLLILLVTGLDGVQEHVGECIIASAIASLGWFHQLAQ